MLRILRQWIINNLGFSRSEANGTLILIVMLFLAVILPRIYLLKVRFEEKSLESDRKILRLWVEEVKASIKPKEQSINPIKEKAPESFPFDPNIATSEQLGLLGFSQKSIYNLLSYRSKGGIFKTKPDLLRIYGISSDRVNALWNQIQLPEKLAAKSIPKRDGWDEHDQVNKTHSTVVKEDDFIDINSITYKQLQSFNGIGPVLSDRIIRFRDKLGGFYSTNQLYEVYGLDSLIVGQLLQSVTVSSPKRNIPLNCDSLKQLIRHPYLDYNTAKAIYNYRKQRGTFQSVDEIKSIKIISDSLYQKIYPYLSLNP